MQLHSDVHDGTGPYLMLLHGFLSSRAQFEPNLAALAEVARPVVVELWGHGRSPVPEDPAFFHPDAYLKEFERLRKRLGVERWIICGQSLGAALTIRYALEHPKHITAQIFTNSTSAFADAQWGERIRQAAPAQSKAIEKGGREGLQFMPIHPKHATRLPERAKVALLEDTKRLDPLAVARTIQYTVPDSPLRERVKTNTVPALLVCGTWEKRFAEHRAYAETAMPGLEIVNAEAGHAVNIEAAQAFNTAVVDFIKRQTVS